MGPLFSFSEARRGADFFCYSFYQSSDFILPGNFRIEAGDLYSVRQFLYTPSVPSGVVKVDGTDPRFTQLPAPTVQAPICPGDYFLVASEPTLVRFQRTGSVPVDIAVSSNSLANSKLDDVDIPSGLRDGDYRVSVVVGADELESNTLPFDIFTHEPEPEPEPEPTTKRYQLPTETTRNSASKPWRVNSPI